MYFDIHSHILPAVDDGSANIHESLELLKMAQRSGISGILATPHFYPNEMDLEEFCLVTRNAFDELGRKTEGKKLPRIYLGAEILYFDGLGSAENLELLGLNGSKYLLVELTAFDIKDSFFQGILTLRDRGFVPIIAHIERYRYFKGFKRLLRFVRENKIAVQINCTSVLNPRYKRVIKKLLNSEIFCVLGTDAHSVETRPPLMKEALTLIRDNYGKDIRTKLTKNSARLFKEITGDSIEKQ